MEYLEFERILSAKRMQRYKDAANGDTRKAMALYRYNLRLSQEMFTIVSCFEVALRNAIDSLLVPTLGENWLKDSVQDNGIFSNGRMNETRKMSIFLFKFQIVYVGLYIVFRKPPHPY